MRILYVAHRIPYPPNKGDKIRSFHQVQFLSGRHELHLACLIDERRDVEYARELTTHCRTVEAVFLNRSWAKLRSLCYLPTTQPLTLAYFYAPALRRTIRRLCRTYAFDMIMAFSSSMAQYVLNMPDVPKVLDMVDVDSDKWRQYALFTKWPRAGLYTLEWRRMEAYERYITERFDRTLVIAPTEVRILHRLNPHAAVTVIPNGIDLEWFSQPNLGPSADELQSARPYVLFTGALDYFANIDGVLFFARQIWPEIRRRIPSLRFYVVGMNPAPEIRALAREDDRIIVTGFVPDTRPYLAHAAACVVPLRIARGIQNKVLEAMAAGVPVVATPLALEGLQVESDREVLCAADPESFSRILLEVIQNPGRYRALAEQARRTLREQYSWTDHLARLDNLLHDEHLAFQQKKAEALRMAPASPSPPHF